jgi:hypothetical protein
MNKNKAGQQKGKEKFKKSRKRREIWRNNFRLLDFWRINLSNRWAAVAVKPQERGKTTVQVRFRFAHNFRLLSYLTFVSFLFNIGRTENFYISFDDYSSAAKPTSVA